MDAATHNSQRSTIEIEQHVRQLNDEWVKAMVRADAATLERIMADDFYFTYPLEGDDKAQFIADVTSGDLKIERPRLRASAYSEAHRSAFASAGMLREAGARLDKPVHVAF